MLDGMAPLTFPSLIRTLRGRRSQAEVAALVGVHQASVSRFERGRVPDLVSGYRLARLLGATAEQLDAALGVVTPTEDRDA